MLIQADELLRNKSINELRDLVSQFESSANSKQSELRQLVGSKVCNDSLFVRENESLL